MQYRRVTVVTALTVLLCFGFLPGSRAFPPSVRVANEVREGQNVKNGGPRGKSAKPLLTIYFIPFEAETFISVTPRTIKAGSPMSITSAVVAADVSRWLSAKAGNGQFHPGSTRLLVVFSEGRPNVLVDQFRGVKNGKIQYKLPQEEFDRLDALFQGMQDAREAAEAKRIEKAKPALIKAVEKNDLAAVKQLLEAKADPEVRDREGLTALMHAAEDGSVDLCETLVDGGANVNAKDPEHDTVLGHAISGGNLMTFRWLLAHGASVTGNAGVNALLDAVGGMPSNGNDKVEKAAETEIVDALLERGAPVEAIDHVEAMTPLMWVIGEKDPALVEKIIRHGGNVNAVSSNDISVLTWAATTGNDPAILLLLAHGAVLNQKAQDGTTALTMAVIENHISSVRLLLTHGATGDARTLKEAAAHRDHTILKLLRTQMRRDHLLRHPVGPRQRRGHQL